MSRSYPTITIVGARMHQLGFTKSEFCRLTQIHERTMTEYLAGRKSPTAEHLFAMADVLGCDASDLTA